MKQVYQGLKKRYRKLGLATKIVLLFSGIILVPTVILAGVWMQREAKRIYEKAQTGSMAYVERSAKDVAGNCNLIENTILVALSQKEFLTFCNGDMDADGLRLVKFSQNELKNMKYIFQSNSLIDSASFYFFNTDVYEIWETIYSYERFQNEEFAKHLHEKRGSIFVLNGITEKGDGYACCYHEVYVDTTLVGILEIRMEPDAFLNRVESPVEQEGYSLLLDVEGNILFPRPGDDILDEAVLKEIRGQFQEGIVKDSFVVKTKTASLFGAYHYLENLDAYAVHCVSRQSIMDGIYRSAFLALLFVVVVLAMLYLIATSAYRRMLVRLEVLMVSMRQVQKGHLDIRVEEHEDGDELDELGNHFNRMLFRIEGLIAENVDRRTAAVNAELNALQSQINSHFLYNALESIRMMAEVKQETEIADTIVSLGSLLRYNMNWKSKEVTLREEITSIERYIYFINMIYEFDVQLQIRLEERLMNTEIPKLCLQPLVENSVVHGMVPGSNLLHITISAVENGKVLVLQVLDDGRGIEEVRLKRLNAVLDGTSSENVRTGRSGIGIANVHKRLQMNYGIEYGIVLQSEENAYTLAKVVMPYEKKELGGW